MSPSDKATTRNWRMTKDLESINARGYFDNPSTIINLDETGFLLGSDSSVVIVAKGGKKKFRYIKGISSFPAVYLTYVPILV